MHLLEFAFFDDNGNERLPITHPQSLVIDVSYVNAFVLSKLDTNARFQNIAPISDYLMLEHSSQLKTHPYTAYGIRLWLPQRDKITRIFDREALFLGYFIETVISVNWNLV